jgi:hypothetical protein
MISLDISEFGDPLDSRSARLVELTQSTIGFACEDATEIAAELASSKKTHHIEPDRWRSNRVSASVS